jgi:alpha-ribazole phosphatase/probable phosphoglycerate mutase
MPELVEVGTGKHEGKSDPAIRAQIVEVLRAWVIEQDLGQRLPDGETGHQVVARMTAAFQKIASAHPGETVAVVGHVASLTVTLGRLCSLGSGVWGTPLAHARPFLVEWDGQAWHCAAWPELALPDMA